MSTIKNNSFQNQYGGTIQTSAMNTKFTDAETATAAIDADNVRNEGIDRINITGTPVLKAMSYSYNNYRNAAGGGLPYTFYTDDTRAGFPTQVSMHTLSQVGSGGEFQLFLTDDGTSTGNPVTADVGDLVRIKFSFNFYGDTLAYDSQDSVIPQTQSGAWIIFPVYKSSSGGSWQAFPQGIDWLQYGDSGPEYNTSTGVGDTFVCPSSDDPTPLSAVRDDGIIVVTTDGFFDSGGGIQIREIQSHGSLNLILTSPINFYAVEFRIMGPFYFHDTAPFSGGGRGWEILPMGGASEIARIERGNFMAQILTKGKGV